MNPVLLVKPKRLILQASVPHFSLHHLETGELCAGYELTSVHIFLSSKSSLLINQWKFLKFLEQYVSFLKLLFQYFLIGFYNFSFYIFNNYKHSYIQSQHMFNEYIFFKDKRAEFVLQNLLDSYEFYTFRL